MAAGGGVDERLLQALKIGAGIEAPKQEVVETPAHWMPEEFCEAIARGHPNNVKKFVEVWDNSPSTLPSSRL